MATGYKNFQKGIGLVPKTTSENSIVGDLEILLSNGKLNYFNSGTSSPVVTEQHASQDANRLKNKDLDDSTTRLINSTDTSKKAKFDLSSVPGSTTVTLTVPAATDTLIGRGTADTLTNKTLIDDSTLIADSSDPTKKVKFDVQSTHPSSTTTLSLPDTTDVIVARNTSDTLTNKTLNLSNNTLIATSAQIASSVTDETGSGLLVFNNTPTIITPTINTINGVQQINNNPGNTMYISSADAISVLASGAVGIYSGNNSQLALNSDGTGNLGEISFDIGTAASVAKVNSSGLTIGLSKSLKFASGASKILTMNVGALVNDYTITLPSNQPSTGTALYYNGSDYVWQSVATAKKTKYDVVVGSAAEVTAGSADYSSLQGAINTLPTGGSILVSSNYSTVENITISTDSILIEGQGNKSVINGTVTLSATTDNCSISNLRITGNVTLTAGCKYNILTNFWVPSSATITDNGTSNYIVGIQE